MSISKNLLLRAFHIFILVLSTGAFASFFINPDDPAAGSPATSLAWLFISVVIIIRTLNNRNRLPALLRGSRPLLTVVAICCASVLWSLDASATAHACFNLVMTTLIAADFVLTYSLEEMVTLASKTILVLVILGIPMDALFHAVPSYDVDTSNWHGLFITKNDCGRIIVLCGALFLCTPRASKPLKIGFICCTYLLLYYVHSLGAVANFTIVLGTLAACTPLSWGPKPRNLTTAIMPLVAAFVTYLALTHTAALATSAGKDPSLTGRTGIWRYALQSAAKRPLLGYGYSAFWGSKQLLAHRIREALNWPEAPHSHNGYIEALLGMGAIGLIAVLAMYYRFLVRSYRYAIFHNSSIGNWPLAIVAFYIAYPFSEASLITGNTIFWILFAGTAFHLGMAPETEVAPSGYLVEDTPTKSAWFPPTQRA